MIHTNREQQKQKSCASHAAFESYKAAHHTQLLSHIKLDVIASQQVLRLGELRVLHPTHRHDQRHR